MRLYPLLKMFFLSEFNAYLQQNWNACEWLSFMRVS
jgi:hypothetical protein